MTCLFSFTGSYLSSIYIYSRTFSIRERYIVPVSSNFPVPVGHNANFAWNQDEVPQNSRYAERFFYSSLLSAQTVATLSGSCQTNQLRSSSLPLGTLSHGAHEPISIVLWTRFLDAPAYGTRCSFAKIAIPYTIYPSLNLLEFYVCINYATTRKNIAFPFISIKTQKSSYNRQIFAQIKRQKNIDSFKKK